MLRETREMLMTDKTDELDQKNSTNTLALQKRVRRWRTSRRTELPLSKQERDDFSSRQINVAERTFLEASEPPKPPQSTMMRGKDNLKYQLREEERKGYEKADRLAEAIQRGRQEDALKREESTLGLIVVV